ncbi:MAG: ACT domain-containing protein [Chloroflexota bacterium]|jgi:hypothetical protein
MAAQVLTTLPYRLAVCRLESSAPIPNWASGGEFFSITRTGDELSLVCEEHFVPPEITCERGWRALMLEGPFDFNQVGILKSILDPLASAQISIFALSTFETDYVLVRGKDLSRAVSTLRTGGHRIS